MEIFWARCKSRTDVLFQGRIQNWWINQVWIKKKPLNIRRMLINGLFTILGKKVSFYFTSGVNKIFYKSGRHCSWQLILTNSKVVQVCLLNDLKTCLSAGRVGYATFAIYRKCRIKFWLAHIWSVLSIAPHTESVTCVAHFYKSTSSKASG